MSALAPLAGNAFDAVIYNEEFFGAFTEVLQQEADVFNGASNNIMRLVTRMVKGDFEKESFLQLVPNLIRSRDPESNDPVASKKMTMDEFIRVKVNKGIGPVDQSYDFWRKIAEDPSTMSFFLGQMAGQEAAIDYVNTGLASVVAAIQSIGSSVIYDAVENPLAGIGNSNPHVRYLNQAKKAFGDKANRIAGWVMTGETYHDLVDNDIADKVDGVAATTIYGGTPGTLGLPVIVTDSPALMVPDTGTGTSRRIILGLVANAVEVAQSEDQVIRMQDVTGQDNLVARMQGEYAYNVGVRGSAFTGTKNPDITDLGSSANWDFRLHDTKLGPGVALYVA